MQKPGGGKRFFKGRRPPRLNIPLNEHIRAKVLRVIDHNGDNLGDISKDEALRRAKEVGLDLFVVSDKGDVPIAKIIDYGKYKFQQSKKEKTTKKNTSGDYKEIKMRYNIDIGDYNTRVQHSKKFLEKGKRVKLNITLRGREIQHSHLAKELANRFLNDLAEFGAADGVPGKMTGRSIIVFILPGADKQRLKKLEEKKALEENAEDNTEL